jgi:hypothetical protein
MPQTDVPNKWPVDANDVINLDVTRKQFKFVCEPKQNNKIRSHLDDEKDKDFLIFEDGCSNKTVLADVEKFLTDPAAAILSKSTSEFINAFMRLEDKLFEMYYGPSNPTYNRLHVMLNTLKVRFVGSIYFLMSFLRE